VSPTITAQDLFEAQLYIKAQPWLEELTEAMYDHYGIAHQPTQYRRKRRSSAWSGGTNDGNGLPRIDYAQPDVLRTFRGDFREYKRTAHVWGRFLNSAMAWRGLYALAVHEFAHVLDRHVNGPSERTWNGDRIIHGRRFCQTIRTIRKVFQPPDLTTQDVTDVLQLRGAI